MSCTYANPCPTANITTPADWFTYSNTVTDGAFGFVLIFMVFLISFVMMRSFPTRQSLPAAMFMATVMGSLLAAAGMVGQIYVFLLLAITIAATVLMNVSRD